MKLTFSIPIAPVPWSRARSNGRTGAYFHAGPYAAFHKALKAYVRSVYGGEPLDVPLKMSCAFVFESPKRRKFGPVHATKPDADNLIKGVKDSLEGVLWVNDSRISELSVKKLYALDGSKPRIEIVLETLEWQPQ